MDRAGPEPDLGALSLSDDAALPPLAAAVVAAAADDDELVTNVWASAGPSVSSPAHLHAAIAAQAKDAVAVAAAAAAAADLSDLDPYAPSTAVRPTPSPRLTIGATVTPSSKLELLDDSDSPTSPSTSSFELFSSPPLASSATATASPPPPPPPPPASASKPKPSLAGASSAAPSPSTGLFGGMFRTFSGVSIADKASSRPRTPPTEERKQVEYSEKHQDPSPLAQPPATASNPISSLFRVKDSSRPASPAKEGEDQRTAGKGKTVEPDVAFDFNRFLEQMRLRSADPIAKYLRSFLKEFSRKPPVSTPDQIRVINDFLDFIAGKMRAVEPWRSMVDGTAGERGEDEFDMAMEAMEKLVMNRLWHLTFSPAVDLNSPPGRMPPTDDLERDRVLSQRIRLFAWLEPQHLDLQLHAPPPPQLPSARADEDRLARTYKQTTGFLEFAKRELCKINQYKAPRDKLICVLNACKVIFGLIRHVSEGDQGADAFVPFLIYVVLKANPDHLVSNLQYIQRFRNPEKLSGEGGYYLSSLNGAISFIESMDSSSLSNITQAEFETNVELAILALPIDPGDSSLRLPATPIKGAHPTSPALPPSSSILDAESPSLIQQPNLSFPNATKAFFIRGTDSVERIVSKPLGAIGRIFDQLESLAGDADVATGNLAPPSAALRRGGGEMAPTSPVMPRQRKRSGTDPHAGLYVSDRMSPGQVSEEIDKQDEQRRLATLETLRGIFPEAEEEVLEMVLLSNSGDMARTIDALLEMS